MTTDARRAVVTGVLEQLIQALRDLSDEDFEKLMEGGLEASVSFVRPAARRQNRRKAVLPVAYKGFEDVHAQLTAAVSREEGQRIVEEALQDKEQLYTFAKYLDLPVQRGDAARRIREKVVTHTVGRRLSGKAVRGGAGGNPSGDGG